MSNTFLKPTIMSFIFLLSTATQLYSSSTTPSTVEQELITYATTCKDLIKEFDNWFNTLSDPNSKIAIYNLIKKLEAISIRYRTEVLVPCSMLEKSINNDERGTPFFPADAAMIAKIHKLAQALYDVMESTTHVPLRTTYKTAAISGAIIRLKTLRDGFTYISDNVPTACLKLKTLLATTITSIDHCPALKTELLSIFTLVNELINKYQNQDEISAIISNKVKYEFLSNDQYRIPLNNTY